MLSPDHSNSLIYYEKSEEELKEMVDNVLYEKEDEHFKEALLKMLVHNPNMRITPTDLFSFVIIEPYVDPNWP